MSDSPTEPPIIDRRQQASDATSDDRPGIVASLLRYRKIVVAATLLGGVAGYALAHQLPVRYRAETVLILADPGGPSVVGGGALASADREVYLAKQADIMTSQVVLERALELLGSDRSVADVRDDVAVQPAANLASVSIVATESDPASAAELANAVGTAYEQITEEDAAADASRAIERLELLRNRYQESLDAIAQSPDGPLTSRQQQLASDIADLRQREQDITAQEAVFDTGVEYFERAELPTSPSQPRPKLAAFLGGLLGLLAASAWAWWAAARGQRAEGRGEPARILEAPLLGEVSRRRVRPAPTRRSAAPQELDPAVEAYRFIVVSMEYELAGIGGKSIAVTSVGACNCKTSTALRIANAASQENRKILLIDGDQRTRRLSQRVGVGKVAPEHDGNMPTMRRNSASAKRYVDRLVSTDSGMVLPIASSDVDAAEPSGSFGAVVVRDAVQAIGKMFDLVLIDSPAMLTSANALGIAGQADGVVLIVPHRVALSELHDVRVRLARVRTPLIGYIYVRPRGLDVRSVWERVTQPVLRTSARQKLSRARGDAGQGGR